MPALSPSQRALGLAGLAQVAVLTGALKRLDRRLYRRGDTGRLAYRVSRQFSFSRSLLWLTVIVAADRRPGLARRAARTLLTFLALVGVEVGAKLALPQPAGSLPHTLPVIGTVKHSSPSGHALRAALVCGLAANALPRQLRAVPAGVAASTAITLVSAGAHYPSDVLVGLLLGAAAPLHLGR